MTYFLGDENMIGENSYKYLTLDEMKSLGDDSMPIDVTLDEKQHRDSHGHPVRCSYFILCHIEFASSNLFLRYLSVNLLVNQRALRKRSLLLKRHAITKIISTRGILSQITLTYQPSIQ